MRASRHVRVWHRRLSIVVGVQLLLWTVSGLVFAWDPIEDVRGESSLADPEPSPAVDVGALVPLAEAWAAAGGAGPVDGAALRWRRGRWCWVLPSRGEGDVFVVDAVHARAVPELDADEARTIARTAFTVDADVVAVERVDVASGEYRDKPTPAWRVRFADEHHSHVYVDAHLGTVSCVRNDLWRRFDFLWMLHIMDYADRTDFGTPWLKFAAALGVATSSTGVWLAVLAVLGAARGREAAVVQVSDHSARNGA